MSVCAVVAHTGFYYLCGPVRCRFPENATLLLGCSLCDEAEWRWKSSVIVLCAASRNNDWEWSVVAGIWVYRAVFFLFN